MPAVQPDDGTRRRILDAAGVAFAESGFDGATIRDISARAGVNLAAVNYHFGDKERLYRATLLHAHELAAVQVPLPKWEPDTCPERKLRDFLHTMLQRMLVVQRLPWQAQLMMREFVQPSEACREVVEAYIRPHHQILTGILDEFLVPETPEEVRNRLAFSAIGQCLFYKMGSPVVNVLVPAEQLAAHYTPDKLAEHIANVMLAALGREPLRHARNPGVVKELV